jgi:hypothetical protein
MLKIPFKIQTDIKMKSAFKTGDFGENRRNFKVILVECFLSISGAMSLQVAYTNPISSIAKNTLVKGKYTLYIRMYQISYSSSRPVKTISKYKNWRQNDD